MFKEIQGIWKNYIQAQQNSQQYKKKIILSYDELGQIVLLLCLGFMFILWLMLIPFLPLMINNVFSVYVSIVLAIIAMSLIFFMEQEAIKNKTFKSHALKQVIRYIVGSILLIILAFLFCGWLWAHNINYYDFLLAPFSNNNKTNQIAFMICGSLVIGSIICMRMSLKYLYRYSYEIAQLTYYGQGDLYIKPTKEDELTSKLSQVDKTFVFVKVGLQLVYIILLNGLLCFILKSELSRLNILSLGIITVVNLLFIDFFATLSSAYIIAGKNHFIRKLESIIAVCFNILVTIIIWILIIAASQAITHFKVSSLSSVLGDGWFFYAILLFFIPLILYFAIVIAELIAQIAPVVAVVLSVDLLFRFYDYEINKLCSDVLPRVDATLISNQTIAKPLC